MLSQFEDKITPDLKWNHISEIPSFPIQSFYELQQPDTEKRFSIMVDYTTANTMAQWLHGNAHTLFFFSFALGPLWIAIASVILALILHNYWLFSGIIIGVLGHLCANPYNPFRRFWRMVNDILFIVMIIGFVIHLTILAIFLALFVIPFIMNKVLYSVNQKSLMRKALLSEKLFILLYQEGKLYIRNKQTKQFYMYQGD